MEIRIDDSKLAIDELAGINYLHSSGDTHPFFPFELSLILFQFLLVNRDQENILNDINRATRTHHWPTVRINWKLILTLLILNLENVLLFSENLVLLEIFFQMGMPNIFISSIPFTVSISNEWNQFMHICDIQGWQSFDNKVEWGTHRCNDEDKFPNLFHLESC